MRLLGIGVACAVALAFAAPALAAPTAIEAAAWIMRGAIACLIVLSFVVGTAATRLLLEAACFILVVSLGCITTFSPTLTVLLALSAVTLTFAAYRWVTEFIDRALPDYRTDFTP